MSDPIFTPPFATPTKRRRPLGEWIALTLGVAAGLLVTAAIGGVLTVAYLTSKAPGDLTTATLGVSMADAVSGSASCKSVPEASADAGWTCSVQIWDYSGNFVDAKYSTVERGDDCWVATRQGESKGSLETGSGLPARLAGCVHALQWANDHWLLD